MLSPASAKDEPAAADGYMLICVIALCATTEILYHPEPKLSENVLTKPLVFEKVADVKLNQLWRVVAPSNTLIRIISVVPAFA
jgi:hypothetical protein